MCDIRELKEEFDRNISLVVRTISKEGLQFHNFGVIVEGLNSVMNMSIIGIIFASVYIPTVQCVTGAFLRRVESKSCSLVLGCNFDQIPARSKGECVFLTTSLGGSGSYYNISGNICNVCNPSSTFIDINSDLGYYTTGIPNYTRKGIITMTIL